MDLKILLLEHPRPESETHYNDVANAPLSTCLISGYVAAGLKERGCSVTMYDGCLSGETFECSAGRIEAAGYDLIGVHAVYIWEHTGELFVLLERLKSNHPGLPIVMYGFFPTFACDGILSRYPFIDAVILGEPDETFADVASAYRRHGSVCRADIAGLAFNEGGRVKRTGRRPLIDPLDRLPFPVRSDMFTEKLGGNILGSRGCYNTCSFCCINPFYGPESRWRGRSPEDISAEIEAILPSLPKKYIYFLDANFFGCGTDGLVRAQEIARRVAGFSLEFGLECRSNDVDGPVLSQLAEAGLRDVFLGIESASSPSLRRMKKAITCRRSRDAVAVMRACGIEPSVGFIMFEPDSTLDDIRSNFEFLQSGGLLSRLHNTADVLYHREIVLRGMANFRTLDAAGRLGEKCALEYEGMYRFADEGVQFLADLMSAVCRRVLRSMASSRSPVCWKRGESAASRRVSEYLAGLFAEVLQKLELGEVKTDGENRMRMEEDALNYIEGLIVEERVCQS